MLRRWLTPVLGALIGLCALPAESGTIKEYRALVLDGHQLKWGEPRLGRGAVVTFALADHSMQFIGARNCAGIAPLGGLLSRNGVSEKAFREELAAAFDGWEAVADITFRETEPARADIILGAGTRDTGRAFTNVVYDKATTGKGLRRLRQSVICLNPAEAWKIGFDGNLDSYDLRYTLLHEIGHAIGLDHPPGRNAVMDFSYRERFRELQPGDIAGIVGLYGPSKPAAERPVVATGAAEMAAPASVAR